MSQFQSVMGGERIAFVDMQGFIIDREFIVKELSISIIDDINKQIRQNSIQPVESHYIFIAPYGWSYLNDACRKQANWLTKNHHGLHWTDGHDSYADISACVEPLLVNNLSIYIKGHQKISWLNELCESPLINCINIEDIGCTVQLSGEMNNTIVPCGHHDTF